MRYKVSISVVMPCYNAELYVQKAIESILNQTFTDFELIVVNDGSVDSTETIVKGITDNRVKYLRLAVNQGNYSARNLGMKTANGKYICVMDSDDWAFPYRLQAQYEYLERYKKVACVGGYCEVVDEHDQTRSVVKRPLNFAEIKVGLLADNCVIHPTIMFRSHLVGRKGMMYKERFLYAADYDFMVRLSQRYAIRNLSVVLIRYRSHPNQITQSKRIEQSKFADDTRLSQLNLLGIKVNELEKKMHLNLMKRKYLKDAELMQCEGWFNKLLEANFHRNIYNDTLLYQFFQSALNVAIAVNSWSIEQSLIDFIKTTYPDILSILEFGSGEGTSNLLLIAEVTSIEHDTRFCIQRDEKHQCVMAPIENNWYSKEVVEEVMMTNYDLILIDGPPGGFRKGILDHLDLFRALECPVIFDDANRKIDREIIDEFCLKLNLNYSIINGRNKSFAVCSQK